MTSFHKCFSPYRYSMCHLDMMLCLYSLLCVCVCVCAPSGVIVSTPTGSTAYAVAAGASMIHPNVPAIMITPICPHSLSFRPIVVPAGVELKVFTLTVRFGSCRHDAYDVNAFFFSSGCVACFQHVCLPPQLIYPSCTSLTSTAVTLTEF